MKVLAINCKSNRFGGVIYLIAAVVLDQEKNVIDEFYGQIPDCFITDKEMVNNVINKINRQPNYSMHMELVKAFGAFYKKHTESEIVFKDSFLSLARLFIECVDYNFLSLKDISCSINNNEYKILNPITEINSLLHITKKELSTETKNLIDLSTINYSVGIYSPIDECKEICNIYLDIFNQCPEIVKY